MPARKPDYIKHTGISLYCDEYQMKRVNSFSADASFLDEDILELSNAGVAETIDDLDTVGVTVDCHEFGSTDNVAKMLNYYQGSEDNTKLMTDALFDNAQCDFTLKVTSGTNTAAMMGTCWYGSQWLTGINLSYSADGNATESFTLEGEYKRWFLNAYRDTYVVSGTRSSSTQATINTNLTGYVGRILTVNGLIVADLSSTPAGTITITPAATSTVIATTDGSTAVTFNAGDRIRLVCYKSSPAAFTALSNTPAGIGALRRGMIDAYLFNGTFGNQEKTLRLQSVGIDISLDRTATYELGQKKAYARSLNRPIEVAISAEAYLDDLETFAKLTNQESAFDADTLNEIDWDSFSTDTDLIVKVYKSETSHTSTNLLKTIRVNDVSITSSGDSADAGGLGTVTFNLKGNNIIISGSGNTPFLS